MSQVKIMALGGLDENGRNMTLLEIDQKIFIIDCGLRYPESHQLGIEVIIPDFSYLIENKERIVALFLTHGHDDVMGAIPFLLKEISVPIYTTGYTTFLLKDLLKKHQINFDDIHRIQRDSNLVLDNVKIRTFGMTHSIPDSFGIAFWTQQGYVVYASEYLIDFDITEEFFMTNFTEFAELAKEGVLALFTEARSAEREGFTSPRHRIKSVVEPLVANASGRIIITLYEQNIFRLLEVIEIAEKTNRKLYFANENQREMLRYLAKLKYYQMVPGIEVSESSFNNQLDNVIIVVSDQGPNVFRNMHKVAIHEHEKIRLREDDLVIIASPVVPGAERDATAMENEISKDGVELVKLSRQEVLTMHPSAEDIKMLLSLLKPKYYIPLKGDYKELVEAANLALNRGFLANRILVLDNGQIAQFDSGQLTSMATHIDLEEVYVDGMNYLDSSGLVLRDRETLSTDGVIVIGVVIDHKTKKILGGPDVQSRGVIYLKDADYIVKECGNIIEETINEMVENGNYDNMSARTEAREKISKYVFRMAGKRPMILPIIVEINS